MWLNLLGADVFGISNSIPSTPSLFELASVNDYVEDIRLDILDFKVLSNKISTIKPDYIFHLAAQPIVKESYVNPRETWLTNTIGTVNLLDSLRVLNHKCIVIFITSDKVYDNKEQIWGYREVDKIGGADPYSASKGGAELAISSFFRSFFKDTSSVKIAIGRAGNVIGGGDWAENRIVPDCIRSWIKNKPAKIRNPNSTRPWQHVLEPLSGYLSLATSLFYEKEINGESFNFGPRSSENKTVDDLVRKLSSYFNYSTYEIDDKEKIQHVESKLLKLNCDKALSEIGWSPTLSFEETISFTTNWYKTYIDKQKNIQFFTISQIEAFSDQLMKGK